MRYTRQQIATAIGISERCLANYIARGYFPRAEGAGRARYYTSDHYRKAEQLRELLSAPRRLHEIARELNAPHCVRVQR